MLQPVHIKEANGPAIIAYNPTREHFFEGRKIIEQWVGGRVNFHDANGQDLTNVPRPVLEHARDFPMVKAEPPTSETCDVCAESVPSDELRTHLVAHARDAATAAADPTAVPERKTKKVSESRA